MRELTAPQRRILDAITTLTAEYGMPPTLAEIGRAVGLRSLSTVSHHVQALEIAGMVTRRRGGRQALARGISVVVDARPE